MKKTNQKKIRILAGVPLAILAGACLLVWLLPKGTRADMQVSTTDPTEPATKVFNCVEPNGVQYWLVPMYRGEDAIYAVRQRDLSVWVVQRSHTFELGPWLFFLDPFAKLKYRCGIGGLDASADPDATVDKNKVTIAHFNGKYRIEIGPVSQAFAQAHPMVPITEFGEVSRLLSECGEKGIATNKPVQVEIGFQFPDKKSVRRAAKEIVVPGCFLFPGQDVDDGTWGVSATCAVEASRAKLTGLLKSLKSKANPMAEARCISMIPAKDTAMGASNRHDLTD